MNGYMSWKWEIRKSKELGRGTKGTRKLAEIENVVPSDECCIAVFHGDPNPHNCEDPWVKENCEMNTTTNIYIVHTFKKIESVGNRFHGVYSSKELADKAGKDYCETWGEEDSLHYHVTIKALDDIINGVQF